MAILPAGVGFAEDAEPTESAAIEDTEPAEPAAIEDAEPAEPAAIEDAEPAEPAAIDEAEPAAPEATAPEPEPPAPIRAEANNTESEIIDSGSLNDNVTYTVNKAGVLTIRGTGAMPDWSIYTDQPWDQASIKSIVIEEGITYIGNYAFEECGYVKEVTFPSTLTGVGLEAFSRYMDSPKLHISDLRSFCMIDFKEYGSNPLYFGHGLYIDGTKVTDLAIPEGVTRIGNNAFAGCSLQSVTFPDSLESIGSGAFYTCSGIEEITIPDSVTDIGKGAFSGCSGIKSLKVPFIGKNEIGSNCLGYFFGADSYAVQENRVPESLTEVVITGNIDSIPNFAFYGCRNLQKILYPDSIKTIGSNAFQNCSDLRSVNVPESVTSIGGGAFFGCKSITEINIPEGVTVIADHTFDGCAGLTEIDIPSGVTQVGQGAFKGCTGLIEILLAENITSIGQDAFSNTNLTSIYLLKDTFSDRHISGISELAGKIKYVEKSGEHYNYTETRKSTLTDDGSVESRCVVCDKTTESVIHRPKDFRLSAASYTYDGKVKKPEVTITDSNGKIIKASDYDVSYAGGRKAIGTYKVTVTMKGSHTGTKTLSFKILPKGAVNKTPGRAKASLTIKWKNRLQRCLRQESPVTRCR